MFEYSPPRVRTLTIIAEVFTFEQSYLKPVVMKQVSKPFHSMYCKKAALTGEFQSFRISANSHGAFF